MLPCSAVEDKIISMSVSLFSHRRLEENGPWNNEDLDCVSHELLKVDEGREQGSSPLLKSLKSFPRAAALLLAPKPD